jgi:hypothetical protein
MKLNAPNLIILTLVISFLGSCALEKRKYLPGYSCEWYSSKQFDNSCPPVENLTTDRHDDYENQVQKSILLAENNSNSSNLTVSEIVSAQQTPDYNAYGAKSLTLNCKSDRDINIDSVPKAPQCDLLILKNGQELKVKVIEVGTKEVRYKLCENLEGPMFVKDKSEVFLIKYPNGTSSIISEIESETRAVKNPVSTEKKIEAFSLSGAIASIIGLFAFGVFFGSAAVIFGAIGLSKINKDPEHLKGKEYAIAGIIVGIIDIVAFFILLSILI